MTTHRKHSPQLSALPFLVQDLLCHAFFILANQPVSKALLETHMAEDTLLSLTDAIDELWFHHNIILPYSRNRSTRDPLSPPLGCSSKSLLLSKSCTSKSTPENKKEQPLYKEKKPATLSIIVGKPVFQLPAPTSRIRRNLRQMRSYKSLSDLENYDLKGFRDLDFMFHGERLNPQMMSMIPGLHKLVEKRKCGDEMRLMEHEQIRRPYLSEAWLANGPYSPLFNLKIPTNSLGETKVKKQLRFWAKNVASFVQSMDPSMVDAKRREVDKMKKLTTEILL